MTSQYEFLSRLIEKLEHAGIPYMVSGSIGSSFHGEPRATNDIDLVIVPTMNQLLTFIRSFQNERYANEDATCDAFQRHSMFNVIDYASGWKADLIIRKNRPYSITEFERRCLIQISGLNVYIATPEDSVLTKLEWVKETGSERQFRDALSIIRVQSKTLDRNYLLLWAKELDVLDLLHKLFAHEELT